MYTFHGAPQVPESGYDGILGGSINLGGDHILPPDSYSNGLSLQNNPAVSEHIPHDEMLSDVLKSPTPSSRLVGEPAYCAGRHCCHWTVNGLSCNNHYPSAEDLDRHVALDHAGKQWNAQPSGDYYCHWAGCSKTESFGNKPKLTRHIHSHTGHKPHQCRFPDCGKGFVTKEQLKNHETTHTKTREHICPQCGKGFAVKTALTSHMNVHKGAKPYICDECGKGFADSSNLSKHKAIHKRTGAKKSRSQRQSLANPWMPVNTSQPSPAHHLTSENLAFNSSFASDNPTQSIEAALQACCAIPCFDNQCSDVDRIPCRSVSPCKSAPCSNQGCSPDCIEPCELENCEVEECHHELPLCDDGDCFQDCNLADCGPDCGFHDCFPHCTAHLCGDYDQTSTDCDTTPPEPMHPTMSHLPACTSQSVTGGFEAEGWQLSSRPLTSGLSMGFDGGDGGGLSDGFEKLHEYINADVGGRVAR